MLDHTLSISLDNLPTADALQLSHYWGYAMSRDTLDSYVRQRAQALGISLVELCERANMSRQTLYSLREVPDKLPSLSTLIALAQVLQVHPLRLLHLIFDVVPLASQPRARRQRGDESGFVRDVTFHDGALVFPGQRFTKTWELQNVGKVPWTGRYLRCVDEDLVVYTRSGEKLEIAHGLQPVEPRVPIPETMPGELVSISVELIAPEPPCTVLSYWKAEFADGTLCYPSARGVWVKVQVTGMTLSAYEDR